MKEFSLQLKRDELGKEKAEAYVLNPEINLRSLSLDRGVEDLFKFRRKRDQKVDNKKHQKLQELMEECTFQPMLHACNRRYAIAHQHKVHDRLYSDASARHWNLKQEQEAQDADWKLNNLRTARSRSPKPPDVPTPQKKIKNANKEHLIERLKRGGGLEREKSRERSATSQSRQTRFDTTAEDTPKTPLSRRGPRASATVLPSKEEILTSRKKSGVRRRRAPSTIQQRTSSIDKSISGLLSSRASSRSPSHEADSDVDDSCLRRPVPQKSVWTGGHNTIMVTSQFKTLLERCQPGDGDEVRPQARNARSGNVDAKQQSRLGHSI
jgi:hypothetical protein